MSRVLVVAEFTTDIVPNRDASYYSV